MISREGFEVNSSEQSDTPVPFELINHVVAQAPEKDKISLMSTLSKTCKQWHSFFQPELKKLKVKKLLNHVVRGEQKEVEEMLEKDASLLLERNTVLDLSGRLHYKRTAFQLAIGAGDKEMSQKIEQYFSSLENGKREKIAQFNEQFPETYNEKPNYDFTSLIDVIISDQFIDGKINTTTETELQKFRNHFAPQATDGITVGKHFDIETFLDALQAYENNFDRFSNANKVITEEQRTLYCCKVIGYLQSLFTACDAQAFCQGIYYLVNEEDKTPLVRNLHYNDDRYEDTFFFSKDTTTSSGLGHSYYLYSNNIGGTFRGDGWRRGIVNLPLLVDYVKQKQQDLQELKEACKPTSAFSYH